MSLAITAFNQIAIMFILILVGILCYKIKLIDSEMNKKLANFVLMLVNPLVIFATYQREFEIELLKGLLISLLLAFATHIFSIILSMIILRKKRHEADIAIERFAMIYSNCGFIGIPLVNGVFGSEGVFYLTAYMTVFNLVAWTHGIVTVSGKNDIKSIIQAILSPSVLATLAGFILFICRVTLPYMIIKPITYIGDMNTPLAMIVSGAMIVQTDFKKLFGKIRIIYISVFKLVIIPLIVLLLFSLFDIPKIILLTSVLACACPTAVTINLFSIKYEKNYLYASELFAVTTILSLITIPIVMIVANIIV